MTLYTLPELPYAYDALDPWCPAETLTLHHTKHHQAYVDGANKSAEALLEVDVKDKALLTGLQSSLTFNLSGHMLHSLFWESLSPEESRPEGEVLASIEDTYGDVDKLFELLSASAGAVQGSGWGALVWDALGQRIQVAMVHDHQSDQLANGAMLAVIDVWEHAYYLKYRNDRPGWIKAACAHLDWARIGGRFADARRMSTV
jgi:Fe-Mn family superoxide dismutase